MNALTREVPERGPRRYGGIKTSPWHPELAESEILELL